jgi:hypothetical protein
VQPALSEEQDKCRDLLLCVHQSFLQPLGNGSSDQGLPSRYILDFLTEFFTVLMVREHMKYDLFRLILLVLQEEKSTKTDPDYLAQKKFLESVQLVPVIPYNPTN